MPSVTFRGWERTSFGTDQLEPHASFLECLGIVQFCSCRFSQFFRLGPPAIIRLPAGVSWCCYGEGLYGEAGSLPWRYGRGL
jgi:hypothetical protein